MRPAHSWVWCDRKFRRAGTAAVRNGFVDHRAGVCFMLPREHGHKMRSRAVPWPSLKSGTAFPQRARCSQGRKRRLVPYTPRPRAGLGLPRHHQSEYGLDPIKLLRRIKSRIEFSPVRLAIFRRIKVPGFAPSALQYLVGCPARNPRVRIAHKLDEFLHRLWRRFAGNPLAFCKYFASATRIPRSTLPKRDQVHGSANQRNSRACPGEGRGRTRSAPPTAAPSGLCRTPATAAPAAAAPVGSILAHPAHAAAA